MKYKNEGHIYIVQVVGNSCCGYECLAPLSKFFSYIETKNIEQITNTLEISDNLSYLYRIHLVTGWNQADKHRVH